MFIIFISCKVWEWKTIKMIRDIIVCWKSCSFTFLVCVVRMSNIISKNLLSTFFTTFITYSKNKTSVSSTCCDVISYSYIRAFIFRIISANWKSTFFINNILTRKSCSLTLISENVLVNCYIFWSLNSKAYRWKCKYHIIVENNFFRIYYMNTPTYSIMNSTIANLTPLSYSTIKSNSCFITISLRAIFNLNAVQKHLTVTRLLSIVNPL